MAKTVKFTEQARRKLERLLKTDETRRTFIPPLNVGTNLICVRNDTGMWYPRFSVLGIDGTAIDPETHPESFAQRVVFKGVMTSEEQHSGGRFVICATPLPEGECGSAYVSGVTPAIIEITNESYAFADVVTNGQYLRSAASGPCSILWKQAGLGQKWSIVKHGGVGGIPDDGVGKIAWIRVTGTGTHPMTGSLYAFNSGSWTFISSGHQLYRPPTHTNNDMYRYNEYYAAVKMAEGVYIALHATPRQFELWGG